jgi:type III secretion protein S
MTSADVVSYLYKGLLLALLLSLPAILAAALVGTLFALVQALTQIQEQTLSFVVKLITTIAVLAMTVRWVGIELLQYSISLFDLIHQVGR